MYDTYVPGTTAIDPCSLPFGVHPGGIKSLANINAHDYNVSIVYGIYIILCTAE